MMTAFVSSAIADARATAQPTPEQRAAIYAARDRAFAVVEEHRKGRRAHIEEAPPPFAAEAADARPPQGRPRLRPAPSRAPHAVKAPAAPRTAALLVEDDTRLGALVTEYLG